jgi:hypothetical protein
MMLNSRSSAKRTSHTITAGERVGETQMHLRLLEGSMTINVPNPWLSPPREEPYVLSQDSGAVNRWNASLDPNDPRRLELHVLPEPVLGLHEAPVVLLMANPGSNPEDRDIDRTFVTPANLESLTTPGGTPIFSLDDRAAFLPGGMVWREITKGLLAPGRGYSDIAEKLLVVQYHGYHSAKPSLPSEHLPSQDFAIALVAAAMKRKAAIIMGTARNFWFTHALGLDTYPRLVMKNSAQSRSLGPGNLGAGFAIVSAALDS